MLELKDGSTDETNALASLKCVLEVDGSSGNETPLPWLPRTTRDKVIALHFREYKNICLYSSNGTKKFGVSSP